jgi:membrane associated rhomboid family serine protease
MHTPWKNLTAAPRKTGNTIYLLIGINVAVFLASYFYPQLDQLLRLRADASVLLARFWTPLTFMFTHDGFLEVIFSMLWLYWMGQVFDEYLGNQRIMGVYLLGGLAGALLFMVASNLIPGLLPAVPGVTAKNILAIYSISGASACVLTIMVATATLLPNRTILLFIWPVKLKWLLVIYAVLDLINNAGTGIGVIIAHAGAALFGFLYIKQLQQGRDLISGITNIFKKASPLKVASKNPMKRATYRPRQDEVDAILDKISRIGYDSLSREEKEILFRASKE